MTDDARPVAVLGAGSWGTALAIHLAAHGVATRVWAREPEVVAGLVADRTNPLFLTGVEVPPGLEATGDLAEAMAGADVVVTAIPVQHLRATLADDPPPPGASAVVTVSKGIESGSLMTPAGVLADLGVPAERIVALSGPSFAKEVAAHQPAAVVAAGRDPDRTHEVQQLFASDRFRVYATDDIVGVEIGGALKNVMALAAGVSDGLGMGDNARAAIITRGLAEITRLGVALGGRPETFAGLSGMGDLVLTCTGALSRNRSVGVALGQGRRLADIVAEMNEVAEGVATCRSTHRLAARVGVEMPITEQLHLVLDEHKEPLQAMRDLLGRRLRDESGNAELAR
jgi:glycerol-3-phosphate dehydrogenase (NAD(P)+)